MTPADTKPLVTTPLVTTPPVAKPLVTTRATASQALMKPIEVLQVRESVVTCDGGGGRLGHPKVYLHMQGPLGTEARQVICPYCSRLYVLTGNPVAEGH
ncbi:zinc-finger domain-containing protein [Acidisoma sp.]|uniref:zinc-finger domain-containing protein n=1 Tax=Acidisoma sp. TaxID=1872115 RepID=UPI003AFFF1FF